MEQTPQKDTDSFANYLQSMVKLDELDKKTTDLEKELRDSQTIINEVSDMYNSISQSTNNNPLRLEDLSTFLEANVPKLLLPDMLDSNVSVETDIEDVIKALQNYAENLRRNFSTSHATQSNLCQNLEELNLEEYSTNLDKLGKHLATIKLNNKEELNKRNKDLEEKLSLLCQDVNMFMEMIQSKTSLSQCNTNWSRTQEDNNVLQYDNIVNRLLSGVNEVRYLLQNKK